MTTYKSYAECKIAHQDSEIVTTTKLHSNWPEFEFLPVKFIDGYYRSQRDSRTPNVKEGAWVICNPADYCSTLKEFLESGFKLDEGDKFIRIDGVVVSVNNSNSSNIPNHSNANRYILSAAAINGGCKIPAKAEQWTAYNNTMPLCELTDEQAAMLFNAWRGFGSIMCRHYTDEVFVDIQDVKWADAFVYRIKTKSERELFIEAAVSTFDGRTGLSEQAMSLAAQTMFDSGKFKLVIKDGE